MTLSVHIRNLLYDHECIILPGFGAFITTLREAEIHTASHTFSPPSKAISFNSKLTKDDGVLNDFISRYEKISYTEARDLTDKYISELKKELDENGKVRLEGIGTISRSIGKKLNFQDELDGNYLPASFGLPVFVQKPLPASHATRSNISQISKKSSGSKYLIAAAIFLLLSLALLNMIIFNHYFPKLAMQKGNVISFINLWSNVPDKPSKEDLYFVDALPSLTSPVKPGDNPDIIVAHDDQYSIENLYKEGYYVIMGSFRDEQNAKDYFEKVQDSYGFAYIIPSNKGFHRVGIYSGEDKEQSLKELSAKRFNQKDAWLLKI